MVGLLPAVEKLHALRAYTFSRRFIPFTVVSVATIIGWATGLREIALVANYGPTVALGALSFAWLFWLSGAKMLPHEKNWSHYTTKLIDECRFEEAERKLSSPPWLAGFATQVKQLELMARIKLETGDIVAAYTLLTTIEQKTLLPDEHISFLLVKTNLLFKAGNYSAFRKLINELHVQEKNVKSVRFRCLLLKSYELELDGLYKKAKSLLEEAIDLAPKAEMAVFAINNLARLEDSQANHTIAQHYYERAWEILQTSRIPSLYPIVTHNLLLKYARNGETAKALSLLEDYRAVVAPESVEQCMQFLNDQTHLARQLGNRNLLLDSYERAERDLKPRLDKQGLMVHGVSELRMRLNDRLGFAEHLAKTTILLDEYTELPFPGRFLVLSELLALLQQCNPEQIGEMYRRELIQRTIAALLTMEEEIDSQLRDISPTLPAVRDTWYGYKIQLCKFKICQPEGISRSAMENLFRLLQERRRVWADKDNAEGEINALIIICDEYLAYEKELGPHFASDFRSIAEQALADAGKLIESRWPHPTMYQYSIGIAWFYWNISVDSQEATKWFNRFEKLDINVAHYASWLQDQHARLKELTTHPITY